MSNENKNTEKPCTIDRVICFSEDDLKLAYRIGFNHAKAVASYQGGDVVEALKRAYDMDKNINWE